MSPRVGGRPKKRSSSLFVFDMTVEENPPEGHVWCIYCRCRRQTCCEVRRVGLFVYVSETEAEDLHYVHIT